MWRGACETQLIFGLFCAICTRFGGWGFRSFRTTSTGSGGGGSLARSLLGGGRRNADARPGLLSRGGGGPAVPCIDLRAWRGPSWRERSHHYSVIVIVLLLLSVKLSGPVIKRRGDSGGRLFFLGSPVLLLVGSCACARRQLHRQPRASNSSPCADTSPVLAAACYARSRSRKQRLLNEPSEREVESPTHFPRPTVGRKQKTRKATSTSGTSSRGRGPMTKWPSPPCRKDGA